MDDLPERNTHSEVQQYYGETLESSADLKTTACCTAEAPSVEIATALADIHDEVSQRYYGCGLVLPEALKGLRILDLGCGAGRDVYLLSRLVGSEGFVTGVDMTPAQLAVARQYQDFHAEQYGYAQSNVEFIEANIEALEQADLADQSYDLIVSNCVVNLAVDKGAVLKNAWRLLKPGGEMYFSDIYADRRVPGELAKDPVLYGECLAGALYWRDFESLAADWGFSDPRLVKQDPVEVTDPALKARVGELKFCSVTYRLFKVVGLEATQEDFGQTALYSGVISGHAEALQLDEVNVLKSGEKVSISGNTAKILKESRFSEYVDILDEDSGHLGEFVSRIAVPRFTEDTAEAGAKSCC